MNRGVATRAERNEIVFAICPRLTPKLLVMNFQPCHEAAELASPAVSA
jgi:hypothetical protein